MDPRFVAIHNAMAATGLAQSGEISQGELGEGDEATVAMSFAPGACYTVVGLGGEGVADLDVLVRDAAGGELARDGSRDAQAAAQFCPRAPGPYQVTLRMAQGSGSWVASAWSQAGQGAMRDPRSGPVAGGPERTASRPAHGGPGTCEQPFEIAIGQSRRGDTATGDSVSAGSCAGGGNAPEHVYAFTLEQRSMVSAILNSVYDGTVYLLGACGDTRSELVCNDDSPSTQRSEVGATLEPGLYYLVVDGFGPAFGEYEVTLNASPMRSLGEVCGTATPLVSGRRVAGTTSGAPDQFQASCAGEAHSGDRVYSIDVTEPSRLRVAMQSTHDGALYLRRECTSQSSEVACNDDRGDVNHAQVTATVEPGRYFVFADGYGRGAAGDFSIQADLTPLSGPPPVGDQCASAIPLPQGRFQADTLAARDDLAASCGGQGGPDLVYRFEARTRSRVRITTGTAGFSPVLSLTSTCGQPSSELVCTNTPQANAIDQVVAPGTYFLLVDGASANEFGSLELTVQVDDLAAFEQSCRQAPPIRPGHQIVGDTTGQADRFQGTCGGGTQSPDMVYRLQLRRTQHVRISSEQTDFDGAIYIRRDCLDANAEVACNDDAGDNRHSMIDVTLPAGTYFVFVDGYAQGNQGRFTLDVDLTNP